MLANEGLRPSTHLHLHTSASSSSSATLPSPAAAARKGSSSLFGSTLGSYLWEEIDADYGPADPEQRKKQNEIYNFFLVPIELEKFLLFGFFVCMDCFVFTFTFFPGRVVLGLLRYLLSFFRPLNVVQLGGARYDVMRGAIFVVCCGVLSHVDVSLVYHYIRGQSIIKLYVIYNVLEIFDKLCTVFGQDIWDALFLRAVADSRLPRNALRLGLHFIAALVYVVLHALVLFNQMVTLNVALNSESGLLITVLVSNQFIELKGCVFKKYSKENLFQISCSDAVERFQIFVFIIMSSLHNMNDLNWEITSEWVTQMLVMTGMIFVSENLVDWIKHCFVTKFNHLTPDLYRKYQTIICSDIVASRAKHGAFDHHYALSRRIGFVSMPLACLVVRVLGQVMPLGGWWGVLVLGLTWSCLVALKALLFLQLYGLAHRMYTRDKLDEQEQTLTAVEREEAETRAGLAGVQRYSLLSGKVP